MQTELTALYAQGGERWEIAAALKAWALAPPPAPGPAPQAVPRRYNWATLDPAIQALGCPAPRGALATLARTLAMPLGTLYARYYQLYPASVRRRRAASDPRALLRQELGLPATPPAPVITIPVAVAAYAPAPTPRPVPLRVAPPEAPLFEASGLCPACRTFDAVAGGLCLGCYRALCAGTLPPERAARLMALPASAPVARPCRYAPGGCRQKATPGRDGLCNRCHDCAVRGVASPFAPRVVA